MISDSTKSEFYSGRRLSYDGHLCTVRYFGSVVGAKGIWVGVEWDDPIRGKHSGEHNGVKYFESYQEGLNNSPKAGSFVRPNRRPDPPQSFAEAVREKYASEVALQYIHGKQIIQNVSTTVRISGKEVEEVGFEKIRQQLADLQNLRIVIVDGLRISRPEVLRSKDARAVLVPYATDVERICPRIVELDLSRNLFEDWIEIADICRQLPKLQNLRANGCRFRNIADASTNKRAGISQKLDSLSLDDTLLSWEQTLDIATSFSGVQNLSACGNGIKTLPHKANPLNVESLMLERNAFQYLSDLFPLARESSLSSLKLKGNRIFQVVAPDYDTEKLGSLVLSESLANVDISSNFIHSWDFIDGLADAFPGITSLRISDNPLFQNLVDAAGKPLSADDGYMLTIARLGRLKRINFSQITAKERLNAETYYLSQIGYELSSAPETEAPSIITRHQRYAELCAEYGEPTVRRTTASSIDENSLAARLIRISLRLDDATASAATQGISRSINMEVPRSLSVYSLMGIVGRKVGLPPMALQLVWETGELMPAPRRLTQESNSDANYELDVEDEDDEDSQIQRDEVLIPRTRQIGSWMDGPEANLRVEWCEEECKRHIQPR